MNPALPEEELLLSVLGTLEKLSIPYMLTGSYASNYYGQPRATMDADVVFEMGAADMPGLLRAFEKEFYVSPQAAEEAIQRRGMFNLIHLKTSFKIDLIVRKDRPYSRTEFQRRVKVKLWGQDVFVAAPEDVILSKLEWSKLGSSERQFQDALKVFRAQKESLDVEYLNRWAVQLDVSDLVSRLE